MSQFKDPREIDFTVDQKHLYREEAITDLKVASIRRLVPVLPDGSDDSSRTPIFLASSQLMTPEGPLPLQARLQATTLADAFTEFPGAMQKALNEMVAQLQQMRQEQSQQKKDESRIIVPGR
ncbi:cytoplasmic protein [Desulfatitalea alkaliphila]|uniref:Cytoplasmic protein n=1 Tax=Desulfatitalea alkaliphila TaxID=2929485 RepID=A0AA41R0G1_9BACT|nr:cytoplasmic protein [Desulfatitalea alkaliphila]MCJ8499281.1 cytoplasmic protein [Desulfatitalea alkaliphila]